MLRISLRVHGTSLHIWRRGAPLHPSQVLHNTVPILCGMIARSVSPTSPSNYHFFFIYEGYVFLLQTWACFGWCTGGPAPSGSRQRARVRGFVRARPQSAASAGHASARGCHAVHRTYRLHDGHRGKGKESREGLVVKRERPIPERAVTRLQK